MLTIQAWLQAQNHPSDSNQFHNNKNDLLLLLQHLLQQNRAWLYAHSDHQLSSAQVDQLTAWIQTLHTGQPLAYIIGEQMFWDLRLKVNQHTLIPRPDTEILIETAIELLVENPPHRILDLGTGSGALALVFAGIYPDANVLATDQSKEALNIAKYNAKNNHIKNIDFLQSDWFSNVNGLPFDLIVSNPPYIASNDSHLEKLQHEPLKALMADQNGMGDYLRIIKDARNYLTDNGLLIFEHGWNQQKQVQSALQQASFKNCGSRKDLAGHDRITFGYKQSTKGA